MVIGILGGTGDLGNGLALRLANAGHTVLLGSRAVERAEAAVAALRPVLESHGVATDRLVPAGNDAVARDAELLFLTAPASGVEDLVASLAPDLAGKLLVDCTVDVPTAREPGFRGTALRLQERLGDLTTVVGGFHTVAANKLLELPTTPEGDVLVVGDDADAKRRVLELIAAMGMRGFDAGRLADGATLERLTIMLIGMNRRYKRKAIGVRLSGVS